jgi:hypothetical protein
MNNEPVAWMQSINKELPDGCECMQSVSFFKENDNDIPLYTHPAKTLTDEEIIDAWNDEWIVLGKDEKFIKFARAILRKAQDGHKD